MYVVVVGSIAQPSVQGAGWTATLLVARAVRSPRGAWGWHTAQLPCRGDGPAPAVGPALVEGDLDDAGETGRTLTVGSIRARRPA